MSQTFGGKNNSMLTSMMTSTRHKKMNESSVNFSDEVVHAVIGRLHSEATKFFDAPLRMLEGFVVLEEVLSGELAKRVTKAIHDCVGTSLNAIETLQNLDVLMAVCRELETMVDTIRSMFPDVNYFPMYEVRCTELKEVLVKQVKHLHNLVLEAVAEETKNHMLMISQTYQDIANTLIAEATSETELKQLQEFTTQAASTLSDLYEQYVSQCFERVKFLLGYKFKLSREDAHVLFTTYNWPLNIQSFLRRSYEAQSSRKRELEELLEEDQRKLENDVIDISRRVEILADNASPMEFRKCVDRIAAMKKDLDAKLERAEEVSTREALLEVPGTDFSIRLEEARVQLEPMDRLWSNVKSYVEKTHMWQETPLADIDPEEAERTADELYRTMQKLGKEFDKMGEKRQAPKRIADGLQNDLKDFIQGTVPLMLLICNPGMKERHWEDIQKVTGLQMPKKPPFTVSMMTEIGLQNYVKEIEDICVSASKEYGLQIAMDKMEAEWKSMIFDTKEYRTSGTRMLAGTECRSC